MKILFVIALAVMIILVAGYGGVKSFDKTFDESSFQDEASKIADDSSLNESEHVECTLNESEDDLLGDVLPVYEAVEKISLGGISFYTSLDSGLVAAKLTKKPVFLYFNSKSCGWCKKFEAEVLTDPDVISTVESSFVSVVIEVNEQYHMAGKFRVYGTPTMIFLDPSGDEIHRIRGFMDVESFITELDEVK
jgi:thiol:disulfide interchange protein DsbD